MQVGAPNNGKTHRTARSKGLYTSINEGGGQFYGLTGMVWEAFLGFWVLLGMGSLPSQQLDSLEASLEGD